MSGDRGRWWLRLIGRLVPETMREAWIREWDAELVRLERGPGVAGRARAALTCVLGSAEDAIGIRGRWGGSGGVSDVRHALRSLARSRTFTVVSAVTLGLGIGANAAIYSVVRTVLLRPLPYADESTLVDVRLSFSGMDDHGPAFPIPASEPEFLELREADIGLRIAGYWTGDVNLDGGGTPIRATAARVSADFMDVLGVRPALGRFFASGEDAPGGGAVAVLSHGLWMRAFGGESGAVGSTIIVNGRPATVVGVLPEAFVFPDGAADLLLPNVIDPASPGGRSSHYVSMIGRIESGSVDAAQARVTELAARWGAEYPGRHGISPTHPLTLVSLRESLVGETRSSLLVLMGVVGLILLIASANVASLMLVRIEHRQSETAVRTALGAGIRGVVSPFLAECAVLAVLGAGLGVLAASGAIRGVAVWGPSELTRLGAIGIDRSVLAFTGLIAIGSAVLFGLVPTVLATRRDVAGRIRRGGRGSTTGRPGTAVRAGLVVAEVALAMVVVTGAGLLLRSFTELRAVEPGLDPAGVVTMDFSLMSADYATMTDVAAFHEALEERLAVVPGVEAAASIRSLPFAGTPGVESMAPMDMALAEGEHWNAQYQVVGPGIFEALGVPLVDGRRFNTTDRAGTTPVAIINEAMADAYWPGGGPLGARVKLGRPDGPNPVLTVVGVVGNVRQGGYREEIPPQLFVPRTQAGAIYDGLGTRFATLVVRSALPPPMAMAATRRVLRELDPRLPVGNERTMSGVMSQTVVDERFLAGLVGTFSVLALILGAVGVGGLMAYTVERRTRELGLRIALGADHRGILARLLGRAVILAAAGATVGLVVTMAGGRVLEAHLFQVSARDPLVLVVAPVALVAAALIAALLPARRAMRIPPTEAMRAD